MPRKKTGPKTGATGIPGVQKITKKDYNGYRVVYREKRYGQYKSMADAMVRYNEVKYCVDNGIEVPPGPQAKRHQMSLEQKQKKAEERKKAQQFREDQKRLRERKRQEEKERLKKEREEAREKERLKRIMMKKAQPQNRQAKYSNCAIQTSAQLGQEKVEEASGFHRKFNVNYPEPVPVEERPKFIGKTQKQRDNDACRKCYWSNVLSAGKQDSTAKHCCAYGIQDGNRSRLAMHYERTGTQDPHTLTHGENCTEWTPKMKKQSTFNSSDVL